MARNDFMTQLKDLGYTITELDNKKVYFEYIVPLGKNIGKNVLMGFEIGDDFPMNCPHGPHFKSVGIDGWIDPKNGVHPSPFGNDWRHWSRPFKEWNKTKKSVKEYLTHIKNVLVNL